MLAARIEDLQVSADLEWLLYRCQQDADSVPTASSPTNQTTLKRRNIQSGTCQIAGGCLSSVSKRSHAKGAGLKRRQRDARGAHLASLSRPLGFCVACA